MTELTYEQRREIERENERKTTARFEHILQLLGFTPKTNPDLWRACATGNKGPMTLYLRTDYRKHLTNRVCLHGGIPRTEDYTPYLKSPPEITITLKKTDNEIADEIKRRYLPVYEKVIEEALRHIQKHHEQQKEQKETIRRIEEITSTKMYKDTISDHFRNKDIRTWSATVNYKGDEVQIEIRAGTSFALEIIKLIQTKRPKQEEQHPSSTSTI